MTDSTLRSHAAGSELDGLVARAARRMVEVSEPEIDAVTDALLAEVGRLLGADVVSLVRHVPEAAPTFMEVSHRWLLPSVGSLPWPRQFDWTVSYPWLYPHLAAVGPYFFPDLRQLPPEAVQERVAVRQGGVTAGLWAPLRVDGRIEGMLSVFWQGAPPALTPSDVAALPIICDVLLAALRRRDLDRARSLIQSRHDTLWESGAVGLADWRRDGRLVRANDAMCRILGVTQRQIAQGFVNVLEMSTPEYVDRHDIARRELESLGSFRPFDKEIVRGDGSRAWVAIGGGRYSEAVARGLGAEGYVFALDIGDRKRLEAQLQQAQKMDAIGQLAGGIAHDFNNLLTVITTSAELAAEALPRDAGVHEDLTEIVRTTDRAAQLTRQLLAFGRRQHRDLRVLDLNDLVRDMERLLRRVIGADVSLVVDLDPTIGSVRADEGQLQQVLLNLAVNGRDAMPDGGILTLRTAALDVRGDEPEHLGILGPGRFVRITVADTGHGMDAATIARAFEPFFSTKPTGRGTGLGLSVVYGIVRQSGGNVWIARSDASGTRVDVCLPIVDAPVEARPTRGTLPPAAHGETVLLVEDDDSVRALTERLLRQLGYRVIVARDGGEALARWQESRQEIALLLSDVVMPGMSGHELAEMLRTDRPELPIVLMSGYSRDRTSRSVHDDPRLRRLDKPFTAAELAERLADVLAVR